MTEDLQTKIIAIGDPHIKIDNIPEFDMFVERVTELIRKTNPDLCIVLGDILHTHERLHTTPLNKAYEFIQKLRDVCDNIYVIVGNHDLCMGRNTPIRMWDGTVKMVQDIKENDLIIGDDGNKRCVNRCYSGKTDMFKIKQNNGDDYIVTKNHLLSLKCGYHKSIFWNKTKQCWTVKWIDRTTMSFKSKMFSLRYRDPSDYNKYISRTIQQSRADAEEFMNNIEDIDIIDISVEEYLNIPNNVRSRLYGFKCPNVNWVPQEVYIDPYILGMWIGDGCKHGKSFSSTDAELIHEWWTWAHKNNAEIVHNEQYNYGIRNCSYKTNKKHDIYNPKHNTYNCIACQNHINKYGKAPSISCADISEIDLLINDDKDIFNRFTKNASKEQIAFIANKNNLLSLRQHKLGYKPLNKSNRNYNPLDEYNLCDNKHIPIHYLHNDKETRLQLLAGIVDTNGVVINNRDIIISQGGYNMHLINELEVLCRSLGFTAYSKKVSASLSNLFISGRTEIIPTRLQRKRCTVSPEIDSRGYRCKNKLLTSIEVVPVGIDNYYGFSIDNNNRFLLGDFTVTHNCNNRQFLTENHWMNGMKEWNNVVIVDKVVKVAINQYSYFLVPYVPPGRFQEALKTYEDDFLNADIIFAHQEFSGCKMGAIISIEGDRWPLDYPQIISGHIHSNQTPQKNIYYPGSAMQHAFGESEKNIIPIITMDREDPRGYTLEEVDLGLPRKKIVYMGIEDITEYTPPTKNEDKIKVTVSGVYEEFKALKKTKKYRDLTDKGVKIVFKPSKIIHNEEPLDESLSNFDDILLWKVNASKNPYLVQAYELVVNNKEISADEVLFV